MCNCYGSYPYAPNPPYAPVVPSLPYTFASPYQYVGLSYGMPYGYPNMYDWGCNYYGLPFGYAYAGGPAMAPPYAAMAPGHPRGEYKVGNCLMICQ